jgi:protein-L-isoaspartate(D-aspartate) O-methyltransferase
MVERQLVRRGISDERVIAAMKKVPRHRFVAEAIADRAYDDCALPIGEGQTISQPFIVGRTVAALNLTGGEKVLEVGAGSGYQAAVLAECARRVYGIERIRNLTRRAQTLLEELGYTNVLIRTADGCYGWHEHAPYDAIAVAAASPEIPPPLLEQLAVGGRLVIPVGGDGAQTLQRIVRTEDGYEKEVLEGVQFVPLIGRYGHPE